jgi:septum formation protein
MTLGMRGIVLASGSPRRREILSSLGVRFEVISPDVEESPKLGETPFDLALRLAGLKALDVSCRRRGVWTIGADTVVDVDGTSFGKPVNREESFAMLRALSGRAHLVHTGVAVALSGVLLESGLETTKVFFAELSDDEIQDFVQSGAGDDKAGAYAIQGRGALLVERIEGCYYNVVGLPVFRLSVMLKKLLREPTGQ